MDVVLVVDDDPDLRALMALALQTAGLNVRAVGTGADAVAWVRGHGPTDAVVLDVQMPRMDGWETLAALRVLLPDVPVLMCTVKVRDADRARESRVAFLPKPFAVDALVAEVRGLLRHAEELTE
jgi:DNA-binding response OmpR family regulator